MIDRYLYRLKNIISSCSFIGKQETYVPEMRLLRQSDVQDPGAVSDATIDQLVHRLREKVEKVPSKPARIVSKKGFGYLLV